MLCNEDTLYVCGCRGSMPVCGDQFSEFGGRTTCFVLKRADYALVLDAGSGLYADTSLFGDCTKIDILLSHFHTDHILGLMSVLGFSRGKSIRILSGLEPEETKARLSVFLGSPYWPVDPIAACTIEQVKPGAWCELTENVGVYAEPISHPNGAFAYRVLFGERKIAFMTDFEHNGHFPEESLKGYDLLIYDGCYGDEDYGTHVGWGHSTYNEGCRLAAEQGIGKLLITHHTAERTDSELRAMEQKARALYANTVFARDGMQLQLSALK